MEEIIMSSAANRVLWVQGKHALRNVLPLHWLLCIHPSTMDKGAFPSLLQVVVEQCYLSQPSCHSSLVPRPPPRFACGPGYEATATACASTCGLLLLHSQTATRLGMGTDLSLFRTRQDLVSRARHSRRAWRGKKKVWSLSTGFRGRRRNVGGTNQIGERPLVTFIAIAHMVRKREEEQICELHVNGLKRCKRT